jgi:hypothetical protein
MKITLKTSTKEGRYGDLVHETIIPDLSPPPDVITWGVRTFGRPAFSAENGKTFLMYREIFGYVLPISDRGLTEQEREAFKKIRADADEEDAKPRSGGLRE